MIDTPRTPPFGRSARIEAGEMLRRLQRGESLSLPRSRPMPRIGGRVHELRVRDPEAGKTWRIVCRADADAILVIHWFEKRSRTTPDRIIRLCRKRLEAYDHGR